MNTFTSPADEAFFAAIGRLAISWAHLEAGVDMTIAVVHPVLGGKLIESHAPRISLARKIRYLRRWLSRIPVQQFQDALSRLLDEIEVAAEHRHDIIHGFVIEQIEGSGQAKMIRLLKGTSTVHEPRQFTVTTQSILQNAVAVQKLGGKTLWLANALVDVIQPLLDKSK